jgi:hypothetical protein
VTIIDLDRRLRSLRAGDDACDARARRQRYGRLTMIRLRAWIVRTQQRPVIGLFVLLLVVVVLAVSLFDLHEECPTELVAAACAALLVGALVLAVRGALGSRPRRFPFLDHYSGRAPPFVPLASLLSLRGPPRSGVSPLLR